MRLKKLVKTAIALLTAACFSVNAAATDINYGNADGTGFQNGIEGNKWTVYTSSGNPINSADGLRITIYDAQDNSRLSTSIDITGYETIANVSELWHFESSGSLLSKTTWLDLVGTCYSAADSSSISKFCNRVSSRMENTGYSAKYVSALSGLTIVSENNTANLEAIKSTLGKKEFIVHLCSLYNNAFTYEDFEAGKYKIAFEPVAYFTYGGIAYALSATECGLLNWYLKKTMSDVWNTSNNLRALMGPLTHSNLPRSAFLESRDLGISAYSPTDSDYYNGNSNYNSDICIIRCMGIGVLSGTADEEEDLPDGTGNADYHTDTKVYTSFEFTNTSVNSNHFAKYILSKTTKNS